MFACLYTHDKFLSNILDRLPRIPRLYCSRKLPLDVSDEKLLGAGSTLEEILYGTDSEGWNNEESHPVDLLRARFIFATLREDILNVRLGAPNDDKEMFIRYVCQSFCDSFTMGSVRSHTARQMPVRIAAVWEGIPSRVRFDPSAPDLGEPYTYITNLFLYLEYLDLYYCAHQLLCRYTGKTDDPNLLQMALTLMTTVVNCARRYCRRFGASKEVSSIVSDRGGHQTTLAMELTHWPSFGCTVFPVPSCWLISCGSALNSGKTCLARRLGRRCIGSSASWHQS